MPSLEPEGVFNVISGLGSSLILYTGTPKLSEGNWGPQNFFSKARLMGGVNPDLIASQCLPPLYPIARGHGTVSMQIAKVFG